MQHHHPTPSPLPDIIRSAPAPHPDITRAAPAPHPHPHSDFLIISLFALRLAKRLITTLDDYPDRHADLTWLNGFLSVYTDGYALAKVSGRKKEEYLYMYPRIVSRMKKQPRYPVRFMQMNPDQSMYMGRTGGSEVERRREMSDSERIAIIDFCDAAAEWGSTVPIPANEAQRMVELAGQRLLADGGRGDVLRREELESDMRRLRIETATPRPLREVRDEVPDDCRRSYGGGRFERGDDDLLERERRAFGERRNRRVVFADEELEYEERRY